MRVLAEARYHVPMQMGREIAEGRQIDLLRAHYFPQDSFHRKNDAHEICPGVLGQIGHLLDVVGPDDAAKTAVARLVDVDDAAAGIAPNEFAAIVIAKFTAHKSPPGAGPAQGTSIQAREPLAPDYEAEAI